MKKIFMCLILGILSLIFLTTCEQILREVELSFTLVNNAPMEFIRGTITPSNTLSTFKEFIKISDTSTYLDNGEQRTFKVTVRKDIRYEYDIKLYTLLSPISSAREFSNVEILKNKRPTLTIDPD